MKKKKENNEAKQKGKSEIMKGFEIWTLSYERWEHFKVMI